MVEQPGSVDQIERAEERRAGGVPHTAGGGVPALSAELPGQAGEDQHRLTVDDLDLRHLEMPEARGSGQRWPCPPPDEVVAAQVAEDASAVRRTGTGAGGDEHVPARTV